MLKKDQRLKSKDIPHLARKGKKLFADGFEVRVWWDNKVEPSFSISVSTAIDKRAVIRNKIKRKFKAAILELINSKHSFRNGKYLIIVRSKRVLDIENSELAKSFLKALTY